MKPFKKRYPLLRLKKSTTDHGEIPGFRLSPVVEHPDKSKVEHHDQKDTRHGDALHQMDQDFTANVVHSRVAS
jgi:hypothetical protein